MSNYRNTCILCIELKPNRPHMLAPGRYFVGLPEKPICGHHIAEYIRRLGQCEVRFEEDKLE